MRTVLTAWRAQPKTGRAAAWLPQQSNVRPLCCRIAGTYWVEPQEHIWMWLADVHIFLVLTSGHAWASLYIDLPP